MPVIAPQFALICCSVPERITPARAWPLQQQMRDSVGTRGAKRMVTALWSARADIPGCNIIYLSNDFKSCINGTSIYRHTVC